MWEPGWDGQEVRMSDRSEIGTFLPGGTNRTGRLDGRPVERVPRQVIRVRGRWTSSTGVRMGVLLS